MPYSISMHFLRFFRYLFFFWSITVIAIGCTSLDEEDQTEKWSAQQLYNEAKSERIAGNYETALDYYQKLESHYPFGRYAQQAQIETIYVYYKSDEPTQAIASAERFIKLYPRHAYVDYAYYIKGITNFNLGKGFLDQYLPMDPSQRDPGAALKAFQDFGKLIKNFPNSKYAEDAQRRMLYLRNNLAKHEVHVANYYLRRGAYVAAANRGKYVVENYQGAPSIADALLIMIKAYRLIGVNELSLEALRILQLNFPDHPGIGEVKNMTFDE
uniref:Outer membrane protein assembly factor BamD n=1 Tax=Candidatus Kentrum sp. TUN TaxID=2126343 RepID=A0A450ZRJ3_9GAMM|nr:MAG: Beta-barrel assembly machine subunit BamD [Candidatus Kentron sp. TUN]VFK58877.1 MAG: Beta-barrel assembly machine subunit BamD [Candidatus Kentron sp. TUN]VFK62716.1 MAG: Beta-barrel assembly machine subunit BamD [Candidatus Kentron sp. TUN]